MNKPQFKDDAAYMANQIFTQLKGFTIGSPIVTPDDEEHERMFGFQVTRGDGMVRQVWVLRDPEGNGPGWLDIEDWEKQ